MLNFQGVVGITWTLQLEGFEGWVGRPTLDRPKNDQILQGWRKSTWNLKINHFKMIIILIFQISFLFLGVPYEFREFYIHCYYRCIAKHFDEHVTCPTTLRMRKLREHDKQCRLKTLGLIERYLGMRQTPSQAATVANECNWTFLVGGWTNPFEKYARQIGSYPQVEVKIKSVETTTVGI